MFEIEIKDKMYQFNFGLGFMREVQPKVQGRPDQNGVSPDIGLGYMVARIMDRDCITLSDALLIANKGFTPRLSQKDLDTYLEDKSTDIDKVFDDVMGFLKTANATKKTVAELEKAIAESVQTEK